MRKTVISLKSVVSVFLLVVAACGGNTSLLEEARFALDSCNPAKQKTTTDQASIDACNAAFTKAKEVLASDPSNIQAALIASSAKVGLAGFDFLQFASTLVDSESKSGATDQFKQFGDQITKVEAANDKAIDLGKMNEAIEELRTVLSGKTSDDSNKKAFFQLGALSAIDTFVRPVKLVAGGTTSITTAEFAIVDKRAHGKDAADVNLTNSGLSNEDTLKASREAFCRCTINAKSVGGWTEKCLRDVMRCNIEDKKSELLEQDYNSDSAFGTTASHDADCTALNKKSDALTTCKKESTVDK